MACRAISPAGSWTTRDVCVVDQRQPRVARYPARCAWLCDRLGLDAEILPAARHGDLDRAIAAADPQRVDLVFPDAFLNNAPSMFGHTLLVVRGQAQNGLLGMAISYAADTQGAGMLGMLVAGTLGGYSGYYATVPYWQKIQEYGDIEQRDLWEYRLNLRPAEIRRMLLHAEELRGIASDYWFFDENCAYALLFLLDAARPGLHLHRRAGWWVIPVNSVRLVQQAGLIDDHERRPSLASRLRTRSRAMADASVATAIAIAHGDAPAEAALRDGGDATMQAAILDLACDLLQVERNRQRIDAASYQARLLPLLKLRSRVGPPEEEPPYPETTPPHAAHAPVRLGLGGGVQDGRGFAALSIRAAIHELIDPPAGYPWGGQVVFGSAEVRWYEEERLPDLERLDAVDIRNLAPSDRFFTPVAWRLRLGVEHQSAGSAADDRHDGVATGGAGLSFGVDGSVLGYALALGEARLAIPGADPGAGIGAEIGLLAAPWPWCSLHASAGSLRGAATAFTYHQDYLRAGLRLGSGRLSAALAFQYQDAWEHDSCELAVSLLRFF